MKRYLIKKTILQLKDVDASQIADMLPSKTVPDANNGKKPKRKPKPKVMATAPPKKKARASSVEIEEIEDEDSTHNIAARNNGISPTNSFKIPDKKKVNCSSCR
jgi:hypothetical protein